MATLEEMREKLRGGSSLNTSPEPLKDSESVASAFDKEMAAKYGEINESIIEATTLAFRKGTSDKLYVVQIVKQEDEDGKALGYGVKALFGRRGADRRESTKVSGVAFPLAQTEAAKLVKQKKSKGYKEEPNSMLDC